MRTVSAAGKDVKKKKKQERKKKRNEPDRVRTEYFSRNEVQNVAPRPVEGLEGEARGGEGELLRAGKNTRSRGII